MAMCGHQELCYNSVNGDGRRVFSIRLWGEKTFPCTEPIIEEVLQRVIWHKKKVLLSVIPNPNLIGIREAGRQTQISRKREKKGGSVRGQVL